MTLNNVPKVIKLQTPWDDVDICSIFEVIGHQQVGTSFHQ